MPLRRPRICIQICGYPTMMLNRTTAAVAMLAAPIAVLAGCGNSQTGDDQAAQSSTTSKAGSQTIKAELKTADGTAGANAPTHFSHRVATVSGVTTGKSQPFTN